MAGFAHFRGHPRGTAFRASVQRLQLIEQRKRLAVWTLGMSAYTWTSPRGLSLVYR